MTLYRKSRRPFTEAEERMWHYLTEEARQVVPVDGPVYRIHIANDWIGEGPMSLVESLIEDGVLVEVGEDSLCTTCGHLHYGTGHVGGTAHYER